MPPLNLARPYLLFLGGCNDALQAKTAVGLQYWAPDDCLGVFADASLLLPELPRLSPDQARQRGARSMVIGVAPHGGRLDPLWHDALVEALDAGLNLISGLHESVLQWPAIAQRAKTSPERVIELRLQQPRYAFGTGRPRSGHRLLTVGTDCMCGKKTAALALAKALRSQGLDADFRATGQGGVLIAGQGIVADAIAADFLIGAVETLTPASSAEHWDIIEGQGCLLSPVGGCVALGLIKGGQPDGLVLCHDPQRTCVHGTSHPLPDVDEVLNLTLTLARRQRPQARLIGICLRTDKLDAPDNVLKHWQDRYGVPVCDPLRWGVQPIVEALLSSSGTQCKG